MNTKELVEKVETTGIDAMIVCIDERFLDKEFLGRKIDTSLLRDLPSNVDACGENGEYHTFVYNAPFFSSPINIDKGDIVYRKYPGRESGFYFLDLYEA